MTKHVKHARENKCKAKCKNKYTKTKKQNDKAPKKKCNGLHNII